MEKKKHLQTILFLVLLVLAFGTSQVKAFSEIPEASFKAPPMVPERSVSTFIQSEAAQGQGLALNVIYPEKPRFSDGAPVAVLVPGGDGPSGLDFSAHTIQFGFAEVRFSFPGGGRPGFMSGGIYDYRGAECQKALRDVLLFAAGKTTDTQGRHIWDLVPTRLSRTNIGLLAWSTGGNITLTTLANYADKLPFVSWIAFYESPVGSMLYPPNLGSLRDLVINHHYRLGSCATGDCLVDYRRLKFDPAVRRHADEHKKRGEPEIPGVLYFDDNQNGRWDEQAEFAFSYALDVGLDKQIYPPDVTAAMDRLGLFMVWKEDYGPKKSWMDPKLRAKIDAELTLPEIKARKKRLDEEYKVWAAQMKLKKSPNIFISKDGHVIRKTAEWPKTIATLPESEAYFKERDGSLYIKEVCDQFPNLMVTVYASKIDHMQRQPDHPHTALLYNAFLADKVHWLRLNPDPIYVGTLAAMNQGNFANNKPNMPIDASSILTYLEPEALIPDYLFMDSAIAELADRCKTKSLTESLEAPLVPYSNGAAPPPKPPSD